MLLLQRSAFNCPCQLTGTPLKKFDAHNTKNTYNKTGLKAQLAGSNQLTITLQDSMTEDLNLG